MGFSGWSPEAVEFFQDLRADNTKAYWIAHKDFYEASVREPMAELLDELSGEFGQGRIARPYRDIRFRADKSPYKTEIYATVDRGACRLSSYPAGSSISRPAMYRSIIRSRDPIMPW